MLIKRNRASYCWCLMDSLISQVENCVPKTLVDKLVSAEHQALLFLLSKAERSLFIERNYSLAKELAQIVLDATWELLNTRHWKEVPLHDRQIYTIASVIKILSMLHEHQTTSGDHKEVLKNALQAADMSLLLGAPLSAPYDCSLMKVAQILTEAFSEMCSTLEINVPTSSVKHQTSENNRAISVKTALESIPGIRGKPLQCLEKPSLEKFHKEFFQKRIPVKLKGCISHWPALERWKDIDYLRRVAGARTVPIELGAHYVDPDWSQKLMTFSDFLDRHVTSSEPGIPVGYLAQHPLFDQVPILKSDIYEPEYCCLSDSVDNEAESIDVNAWFGPRGTVSPLHHDPKHNLLSQVVGEKRIILYRPEESELLYPHDTTMLGNTARVDPESPDYSQFPRFRDAHAFECHLEPGDMVYIPPKWWHHVRSLSTSFSVSFWWI